MVDGSPIGPNGSATPSAVASNSWRSTSPNVLSRKHPDNIWLRHRAVLALARAGSTGEAARRFDEYGLAEIDDEDVQSLHARIAKDLALGGGEAREGTDSEAASLYCDVFRHTSGPYPGVNAATLLLLAGRVEKARQIATRVLELISRTERLLRGRDRGRGAARTRPA